MTSEKLENSTVMYYALMMLSDLFGEKHSSHENFLLETVLLLRPFRKQHSIYIWNDMKMTDLKFKNKETILIGISFGAL